MRNVLLSIALFFALATAALAAEPSYQSVALNTFATAYQQAYDGYTLDAFQATVKGTTVEWQGEVIDINNTGTSFYIRPNGEKNLRVFVTFKEENGKSVNDFLKVGQQVVVRGRVSSVSVLGAILEGRALYVPLTPEADAK